MIDLDITFFIQLVNFLIVWMVLNLILYRPIRGIIKKRSEHMDAQMDAIERFNSDATTKLEDYEKALVAARQAGNAERTRLKDEGVEAEKKLLAEAGSEAAGKVSAAKAEIGSQAEKAMETLKAEVQVLAKRATAKILGQA